MNVKEMLSEDDSLIKDLDMMAVPSGNSSLEPWNHNHLQVNTSSPTSLRVNRRIKALRRDRLAAFEKPISPLSPNEEYRLLSTENRPNEPENDSVGNVAPSPPRVSRRFQSPRTGSTNDSVTTPYTTTSNNNITTIMDFRTGETMHSNHASRIPSALNDGLIKLEVARGSSIFGSQEEEEDSSSASTTTTTTITTTGNRSVLIPSDLLGSSGDTTTGRSPTDHDHSSKSSSVDSQFQQTTTTTTTTNRVQWSGDDDDDFGASSTDVVVEPRQRRGYDRTSQHENPLVMNRAKASMRPGKNPLSPWDTITDNYVEDSLGLAASTSSTIGPSTTWSSRGDSESGVYFTGKDGQYGQRDVDDSIQADEPRFRESQYTFPPSDKSIFHNRSTWLLYLGLVCIILGMIVFMVVYFTLSRLERRSTEEMSFATNDNCQNAMSLEGMIGETISTKFQKDLSRMSSVTCLNETVDEYLLWYFVNGNDQRIRASTCRSGDSSSNTKLSVLTGRCGELQCIGSSDDLCGSHGSIGWFAEQSMGYYIVVSVSDSVSQGTYEFSLDSDEENHSCGRKSVIDMEDFPIYGSTRNLTVDSDASATCFSNQGSIPTAWYQGIGTGSIYCVNIETDRNLLLPSVAMSFSILEGLDCTSLSCRGLGYTMYGQSLKSRAVAFQTSKDEPFYLAVGGVETDSVGDFAIDAFRPPTNGFCETAEPLALRIPSSTKGTLKNTCDVELPVCSNVLDVGGVWYTIQGTGEMVQIEVVGLSCGGESSSSTRMTVFESETGSCADLVCTASFPQECSDETSTVTTAWISDVGITYTILVQSTNAFDFAISAREVEPEPMKICQAASGVEVGGSMTIGSTVAAYAYDGGLCVTPGSSGVWFEVEGTGNSLKASTCLPETNFSATITIMSGSCDDLECTTTTSTTCDGERSVVYWDTVKGQLYYIYIHGKTSSDMGDFALTIEEDTVGPVNDYCGSAQAIQIPSTVFGSTETASDDSTYVELCGAAASAPGVWYTVIGNGRFITASLCDGTTAFDTQLYLFAGEHCQNLTCITYNEDGCGLQSQVSWRSELQSIYYLLVSGFSDEVGDFEMTII